MFLKSVSRHPNRLLLTLLFWFALLPIMPAQPLYAQEVPIVYQHFDTEMTLQDDGVLHVKLIQQIRFDGIFSEGYYAIPIKNVTSIGNVQLWGAATEEDNYVLDTENLYPIAPNYVDNNGEEVTVDWNFPTTSP